MGGHQIPDLFESRVECDALRDIKMCDESARGSLGTGLIDSALETLAPRRVQNGDGEAGGAGDGNRSGNFCADDVELAAQFGDVDHADIGGADGKGNIPVLAWLAGYWYLVAGGVAQVDLVDRKSTRLNSSHANISYA